MSEFIEKWVSELLSTDDEVRKKAASELANADLTLLSPEKVRTLNTNLVSVSGDQNLTIRYFARKLKKRMSEMDILLSETETVPAEAETVTEPQAEKAESLESAPAASPVLAPPAPEVEPVVTEPEPAKRPEKVCAACGSSMPEIFAFCGRCGASMESEPVEEISPPVKKVKTETDPVAPVIAATTSAPKQNLFVKILTVLLVLAFNAFFVEAFRVRFMDFKEASATAADGFIFGLSLGDVISVFTDDRIVQILAGVLVLELIIVTLFRKTCTANGLFKLAALSYLGISWLSLIIPGPTGHIGICAFRQGADTWSYAGLLVIAFFTLVFVWRKGKKKAFIKLILTGLGIYSIVPVIIALVRKTPFTMDIYSLDAAFLKGWLPIDYLKPLYLGINVILPLVFLYSLCVLAAAPFRSGGKAFLGAVLSVLLIGVPLAAGQHLYARSPGWSGYTIHGLIEQYSSLNLPGRGFLIDTSEARSEESAQAEEQEQVVIEDLTDKTDEFGYDDLDAESPGEIINFENRAQLAIEKIVLEETGQLREASPERTQEITKELEKTVLDKLSQDLGRALSDDQERFVLDELKSAIENIKFLEPEVELESAPEIGITEELNENP